MIEHFKFVAAHTRRTPKITIPSPSALHFRTAATPMPASDLSRHGRVLSRSRPGLPQGGARLRRCRLPLSAARRSQPRLSVRSKVARADARRAATTRKAAGRSTRGMINAAISDIPSDMTITMHLCRGNFRSTFMRAAATSRSPRSCSTRSTCTAISWNTTPSAPAASSRCASCRRASGGARPRHHRRPASSKARTTIKRRIDEAAKFVPLDQLCLSPQCGFASTEEGNILAEDEQWAKLRMIVSWPRRCGVKHEAHQAAVPRRPCRQPAAPGRAEGGARAKRAKGEITAAAAQGGRGPRDRARHQEAGRGRPASRSPTANSAAPGGTSISSGASTASRSTSMDAGVSFAGVHHAQRGRQGHRQARLVRRIR